MEAIKSKKAIFIISATFLFIFITGIYSGRKKSSSECEQIKQNINKEAFLGVVLSNKRPSHYRVIIVSTYKGDIKFTKVCPDFGRNVSIGDSVMKLKNTNIIKLKKITDTLWKKYKYKFIPYECGDVHPCDLDIDYTGKGVSSII